MQTIRPAFSRQILSGAIAALVLTSASSVFAEDSSDPIILPLHNWSPHPLSQKHILLRPGAPVEIQSVFRRATLAPSQNSLREKGLVKELGRAAIGFHE